MFNFNGYVHLRYVLLINAITALVPSTSVKGRAHDPLLQSTWSMHIFGNKPWPNAYFPNARPEITRLVKFRRVAKRMLIRLECMLSQDGVTSTSNQYDCEEDVSFQDSVLQPQSSRRPERESLPLRPRIQLDSAWALDHSPPPSRCSAGRVNSSASLASSLFRVRFPFHRRHKELKLWLRLQSRHRVATPLFARFM
jgi:hypothetical protein